MKLVKIVIVKIVNIPHSPCTITRAVKISLVLYRFSMISVTVDIEFLNSKEDKCNDESHDDEM